MVTILVKSQSRAVSPPVMRHEATEELKIDHSGSERLSAKCEVKKERRNRVRAMASTWKSADRRR